MELSVDSGWTTGLSPQVPSLRTLFGTHLVGRGAPWKLEREMSRSGRADAISFFLTPVGVLKSSGGDRHVPEAERNRKSYKNFDLKSRIFFGKVKLFGFCNSFRDHQVFS